MKIKGGSERFTYFGSRLARCLSGEFTKADPKFLVNSKGSTLCSCQGYLGRICDINHIIRANNVINVTIIRC